MSEYEGKTQRERDLQHMESPYREGTKLDRIFLFMQDEYWHSLHSVMTAAYRLPTDYVAFRWRLSRVASALRTIRSHPDLNVRYDGERYCMERGSGLSLSRINNQPG